MPRKSRMRFLFAALVAPLVLPALVYCVVALGAGLGVFGTLEALVNQATGQRQNILASSLLGLAPALLLLVIIRVARWIDPQDSWRLAAGWGGLVGILLVLAWANFEVWPLFLPGRGYPGWPHGIELVIAPLFFAPVVMAVSAVAAALVAMRMNAVRAGSTPKNDPPPSQSA